MIRATSLIAVGIFLCAPLLAAKIDLPRSPAPDVVIVGEVHDNPTHHQVQKDAVSSIRPAAVVFEMLTQDEALALQDVARSEDAMRRASDGFHWGNIGDYAGILAQSPVIVGAALPREDVRRAFSEGAAAVLGDDAALYGLADALPAAQLESRKQMQFDAHCKAMPLEMMGGMVEAQRLRDAAFARSVLEAVDRFGTPVVLITGNGHARTDWGVPYFLAKVRHELRVHSVAQGENGQAPPGTFTQSLLDAEPPERGDPCAAFK